MSCSCLEKISILPLGVLSGYFCRVGAEIGEGNFWICDRVGIRAEILFDEFIQRGQLRKTC